MNKPNCSRHTTSITHFGSDFKSLAKEIGDLRYDALSKFLAELADKIHGDSEKDLAGGRKRLADTLLEMSADLYDAKIDCDTAWERCKPYMNVDE